MTFPPWMNRLDLPYKIDELVARLTRAILKHYLLKYIFHLTLLRKYIRLPSKASSNMNSQSIRMDFHHCLVVLETLFRRKIVTLPGEG